MADTRHLTPTRAVDRLARPLAAIMLVVASAAFSLALPGCDETTEGDGARVVIDGREFYLELALDEPRRVQGLSDRDFIAPDGGMLFVFTNSAVRQFVMRDCLVDIDIIYLDAAGRVVETHQMVVEPRNEGESDFAYEQRLTRYSSRFPSQFVIELAGGMLDEIAVKPGDKPEFDLDGLKRRAR